MGEQCGEWSVYFDDGWCTAEPFDETRARSIMCTRHGATTDEQTARLIAMEHNVLRLVREHRTPSRGVDYFMIDVR